MSSYSIRAIARSLRFNIDRLRAISTYKNMFSGNIADLQFTTQYSELPHVLFVTSNGAGMGHITRCLAIAKSGANAFRSSFVTLSTSAEVVGREGFEYLHFASAGTSGQAARAWNNNFYQFFRTLLKTNDFDVIVFDGTWIYRGLREVLDSNKDIKLIWLRRGLWKKSAPIDQLEAMESYCTRIISPWDIGGQLDVGPLASRNTHTSVRGIVMSEHEPMQRTQALQELGLDPCNRYVLVQLGAGNINDISNLRKMVCAQVLEKSNGLVTPIIASSPLSKKNSATTSDAAMIQRYPISPYLRGFDFVVSAAGYNSVHEIVRWNIPSLVIPNTKASTDDQETRSRALHDNVRHFHASTEDEISWGISALLSQSEETNINLNGASENMQNIDSGEEAATVISSIAKN